MGKRKLKDWMCEDWDLDFVCRDDSRVPDNAGAVIREGKREILIEEADQNTMLYRIFHEVGHKATRHLDFTDEEKEELVVDFVALTYLTFLKKMGVDLAPLLL